MKEPVYPGVAVGYRQWWVDDHGLLMSYAFGDHAWHPGANRACCRETKYEKHVVPSPYCKCGFYAWHALDYFPHSPGKLSQMSSALYLSGVIAARGNLRVHYHGFRAPEAQILALCCLPDQDRWDQLAHEVAERYQVPLLASFEELEKYGRLFGTPPDLSIRPQSQRLKPAPDSLVG